MIKLQNGRELRTQPCAWAPASIEVVAADGGELSPEEWNEYCDKLKAERAAEIEAERAARKARNKAAFAARNG